MLIITMLFYISMHTFRCNGIYTFKIYQSGQKPDWIRRTDGTQGEGYVRYGHIEGMNADQIAYATQASEAVYIVNEVGKEVKADIMKENFNHTDENLYIGFTRDGVNLLGSMFLDLPRSNASYDQVKVEFEVKHMYFDNLVKSVNSIDLAMIHRLLPCPGDFLPKSSELSRCGHISQLDTDDQLEGLKTIVQCPARSPPILINGSFGTGKTRLLAIATYYFTKMAQEPARVLVCAHHQVSADSFVECYFGEMMTNQECPWIVRLIRLTSNNYVCRSKKYSDFYMNFYKLRKEINRHRASHSSENLVIATTFLTAPRLQELFPPGFFTHILLDEGAQAREPESIAPLSLASSGTKIVIAGDSCQVINVHACMIHVIFACMCVYTRAERSQEVIQPQVKFCYVLATEH